jgi:hypothetical protein
MIEKCENCKFLRPSYRGVEYQGACHKNPPKMNATKEAVWPIVSIADWCGEWRHNGLPEKRNG